MEKSEATPQLGWHGKTRLNSCPFCGGKATTWMWHSLPYAIGCEPQGENNCDFNPWRCFKTKDEAVEAWNGRGAS